MPESFTYHQRREVPGVRLDPSDLTSPMSVASGGFATLWRAGDHGQYAIKCFNTGGMSAAEEEFEALLLLSGHHVAPQVYGLGTFVDGMEEGRAAIVEEYLAGYTLSGVLKRGLLSGSTRRQVLSASHTVTVALAVAEALVEVEAAGVSHRDLSANNVMLSKGCVAQGLSAGARVRLIDFGQSTPLTRPSVTPSFRARLATVPYGAPEMYGGEYWEQRNSAKCDVWSFGSLIVTMLAGEYWPDEISDLTMGLSSTKDLERIVDAKREPLDLLALIAQAGGQTGDLEKRLAQLVRRCTQYEPDLRPSAREVRATLARLAPSLQTPQQSSPLPPTPRRIDVTGIAAGRAMPKPHQAQARREDTTPAMVRKPPVVAGHVGRVRTGAIAGSGAKPGAGKPKQSAAPAGSGAYSALDVRVESGPQAEVPDVWQAVGSSPANDAEAWSVLPASFEVQAGTLVRYRGRERDVEIPEGIVGVGEGAFRGCTFVERVLVPDSVRFIEGHAFEGCTSLHGIAIPSVERLGPAVFRGCSSLPSIIVRDVVADIPPYAFKDCTSLEWVRLPARVRSIGDEAFAGCTSLKHVDLPQTVTRVGNRAFSGCTSLHRVDVPPALTSVGQGAFVTGALGSASVTTDQIRTRMRIVAIVAAIMIGVVGGVAWTLIAGNGAVSSAVQIDLDELEKRKSGEGTELIADDICTMVAYTAEKKLDDSSGMFLEVTNSGDDDLIVRGEDVTDDDGEDFELTVEAGESAGADLWIASDDDDALVATVEVSRDDALVATYEFTCE